MELVDKESKTYESGYWSLSEDLAKSIIGGNIYFHKAQDKASYFGGTITGYRLCNTDEYSGRVIFSFIASRSHKDIKTARSGWSMEKKIVHD